MNMASSGNDSERTFCPHCRERLAIVRLSIFAPSKCSICGSLLSVSPLYRSATLFLSFATSLLVANILRIKAHAAIAWLPLLILSVALVRNFAIVLFPPKLRLVRRDSFCKKIEPWRQNMRLLLMLWFAQASFLLAYGLVLGWVSYLVGGTQGDVREVCELFSVPLAWMNPDFVISPTSSLPAAFGIVFVNSFFYAATCTALTRIVQSRLRKPITQIGILNNPIEYDPDDAR
jgi:hypothetical protein